MSQQQQRTMRLGDILDGTQLKDVEVLINSIRAGEVKAEMLRHYLITQRESLEAQDILPEWLYYAILYGQNIYYT